MHANLDIASVTDQHAFNLKLWAALSADTTLAKLDYLIETDRHGHILMTPPPGFYHSGFQTQVAIKLNSLLSNGQSLVECPISTADGVKGADVVWISTKRCAKALRQDVLVIAPEICVEVISKSNTREEMMAKKALYFEAGAEEVWFCDRKGRMFFFLKNSPDQAVSHSSLCADFPKKIG